MASSVGSSSIRTGCGSTQTSWVLRIVTVLACSSLALAATQPAAAQDHDHATAAADVSAESRATGAAGDAVMATAESPALLFNQADLQFLQHMIVHHEQAVVMVTLVPERTDRAEFNRFTDYVGRAQGAEIGLMQSLLDLAEARGIELPEPMLHGDPPMAGMLSSAQMMKLEAASGTEFERLWIEGMIYHHQGAIDMGQAQQSQQLATGRRPYGLAPLVEDIIEEQRAEITRMRGWLEEWGLSQ